MASYAQPAEHFDTSRGFMPSAPPTWNPPMQFNQQYMLLPSQSPQKHPQEFSSHDQWDHTAQSPLASAPPAPNPFNAYAPDPAIKAEETYPSQPETVSQPQLSPATMANSHGSQMASASSPRSDNGWASNSSSEPGDKALKRESLPFFVDNPPRLRSDGIRKKNARFDIPEDRKIHTIDDIISNTDPTDESLMKELKQQKRLLRNRQAALDSRCRKKEFTQKLEQEKRLLEQNYAMLQEDFHQLRSQQEMWYQERASWQATVDRLNWEKEELVRKNTLETADLRKKNNFLLEDAQRRSSLTMSTVPSSAGYSSTFSEFDHLSMNDSPTWDDFSLLQHGHPEPEVQATKPQHVTALAPKDVGQKKEDEKSAGSGLLLMLLLCGAWVASNGSSSAAGIPQMSEDVRAASATVLDNIYKDAGLAGPAENSKAVVIAAHPGAHLRTLNPTFNQQNNPFAAVNHLTAPTLQQQRDEVFSLTPTQYNALTNDESLYSTPQSSPKGKRHLHDALSSLQLQGRGTTSEAYTKSLMWDAVPSEVVKDFARMMNERNIEPMS